MRENPTLFHRGKSIEKISTERLLMQNSVRAEVEEYRKSGKAKL